MKGGVALAGFLLICLVQCEARSVEMRRYTIDLSISPEQRWRHVLSDYNSSVPLVIDYFQSMVPSKTVQLLLESIMANFDSLMGELGQELRGIAEYWGIDLGLIVGLNLSYEMRRIGGGHPNTTNTSAGLACTSIVAQDSDGTIFHGRNLDWNLPDEIRNISIMVDFKHKDQLLFTGVTQVGYVGVQTGLSVQGFSASLNERSLGGYIIEDGLQAVLQGSPDVSQYLRQVLTSAQDYEDALRKLADGDIAAPVYYILAGKEPDQGAVLTRNRNNLEDLWPLNVEDNWYLLETNYDHWKPVDPWDNRRHYGNEYMYLLGRSQAASASGLLEVLGRWPIRNNGTAYTTIMCPITQDIHSFNVYVK
ncbi:N-acylethanolamine-hydrolyzing acid amidase-like [Dysidea avara]|uniref:N-acylethanolamine-hydrolyzing acid amidase-like n=1 Tax=Dysidea avara TaxID=196820 RepID=UPI00332BFB85